MRVAIKNMQDNCNTVLRLQIAPALNDTDWNGFAWLAPKQYRLAKFYEDLARWYVKRAALVDLSGLDYYEKVPA